MLVSSEPESAQWVAAGEETRFYDDIGCLATDGRAPSGRNARFVHADGRWLTAERAYYGRPRDVSTPMGYGFLAFPDRRRAESRDRDGRARTWAEVESELARGR
jgi:copper chaperone NosL